MIRKYRKGEKKKPEGIIFKKASEVRVKIFGIMSFYLWMEWELKSGNKQNSA